MLKKGRSLDLILRMGLMVVDLYHVEHCLDRQSKSFYS